MIKKFILIFSLISSFIQGEERGKILICGVCQNVARTLPMTIKSMIECGKSYDDYHIIIYENNSIDATPNLLLHLGACHPKATIISEKLSPDKLAKRKGVIGRMELIADARNRVLKVALSEEYDDFHYLIMADMDFDEPWNIREIVATTSREDVEWDGVFANGIVSTKRDHYKRAPKGAFYDLYAYRSEDHPLCIESLGYQWWQSIRWSVIDLNSPWQPVYSAFNGMAIYKRESLKGSKYSGTVTPDLEIAVKRWMDLAEEQGHPYVDLYRMVDGYVISDSPYGLSWFNPRGPSFMPEVCEHVALHASMANKGHGKFFINPKLLTYYYG